MPKYQIETDRFMWGANDTFDTFKPARRAVLDFLEDCHDNQGSRWYKTDSCPVSLSTPGTTLVEYEHVSWDPSKPERVRIVQLKEVVNAA